MRDAWQKQLSRWEGAGLIDAATAESIREFEAKSDEGQKLRWSVLVAVSFGGLMLGSGILLFVAANWARLSTTTRFSLVLLMVAVLHVAGALLAVRFALLANALHAIGTAALGAGIYLAAQIFNLHENWATGLMLWSMGGLAGWWLVRNWVQATYALLLVPAWFIGEWNVATRDYAGSTFLAAQLALSLAFVYLGAESGKKETMVRRVLMICGALALIPASMAVLAIPWRWGPDQTPMPVGPLVFGWAGAIGFPLLAALWLRGRGAIWNAGAIVWGLVLGTTGGTTAPVRASLLARWQELGPYFWCAVGAFGLIAWGYQEARKARINLGFACFGMTVLAFYFSDVMDKLGRSWSLMIGGVLMLIGGWWLEKLRRRLMFRVAARHSGSE